MRAELKGFHSPDIFDLENFQPLDKNNFCFYLEISVGAKNELGTDIFGMTVCSPQWLIDNESYKDVVFGRHYLIVFEYNFKRIYNTIKDYIENLEDSKWENLANKIGRIAHWEFEDYH